MVDIFHFSARSPVGIRRPMDVYMKSGLHIDVHWTSKGRLMSTGSSNFLTACWLSIFMSTSRQRFQSCAGVFRRKTEITNYLFWSFLQIFESDPKLSHLDQQSEKGWTFRSFKNKCLLNNDRSVTYLSVFRVIILWNILLQKFFTNSMYIVKTFRWQVCLFDLDLSLSNKIKYCSLLYRTPSLSFRLLSVLWD